MKFLASAILLLLLVGCGEQPFEDPDKSDGAKKSKSPGTTWEKIPASAENVDTPYTVKIERVFQWFNVKQCDGSISRERRTIKHPMKHLEINPRTNKGKKIVDSDVYNDTTEDWRECHWNICKKNQFDAHTSEGASQTLYVRKNRVNKIEYSFDFKNGQTEDGVRYIYIDYSERTATKEGRDCGCSEGCK